MDENGWDYGQDDEELLELAMHPEQYRRYKSGAAKGDFEKDLAAAKAEAASEGAGAGAAAPVAQPSTMQIEVDGQKYRVRVSYGDEVGAGDAQESAAAPAAAASPNSASGTGEPVVSPLEGKFYFTKDSSETPIKEGDRVQEGDVGGYVEAMKTYNAVKFDKAGTVQKIVVSNGADVDEDDVLVMLS